MKKKLCAFFISICLFSFMLVSLAACASDELEYAQAGANGLLYWKVYGIGSYKGKNIDIPKTYYGYEVKAIEADAFRNSHITSVTLPETVINIGERAFCVCSSLREVNMPQIILPPYSPYYFYFGSYCFAFCTSLKKITIPENVASLPMGVFQGCVSLKNITLPKSLKTIENYAFADCDSLKTVYYSGTFYEFARIKIGEGNECLLKARFIFI